MKKTAGFTLIELVIVIVILGILGAVAAPKFLNLQGDAYGANLQAVKSSMESAATLVNTKAILAGVDKDSEATLTVDQSGTGKTLALVFGYPSAAAIKDTLELKADDAEYVFSQGTDANTILVSPQARASKAVDSNPAAAVATCAVKYVNAVSGARPTITIDKSKC